MLRTNGLVTINGVKLKGAVTLESVHESEVAMPRLVFRLVRNGG